MIAVIVDIAAILPEVRHATEVAFGTAPSLAVTQTTRPQPLVLVKRDFRRKILLAA